MLLAILYLTLSLLAGSMLVCLVPIKWHLPEFIAASIAVGLLAGSWVMFHSTWITNYTVGPWIGILLLAAICIASWHYQKPLIPTFKTLPSVFDKRMWLTITIVSLVLFGWLFYTHMLQEKDGAYFSGGSTWGDLALHLSLATRFANQTQFSWDFPIFHGAQLAYPFLIDFLSGMLYRFGLPLPASLFIPGFLLVASLIQLLWFLIYRVSNKSTVAAVTLLLFLGSGAIGGLPYFWKDWQASDLSLITFLGSLPKQYSNLWSDGIYFSNIINDYLLPQRGILFGLAIFAIVTTLLHHAWHQKSPSARTLMSAAILMGCLPFAHTHTFFVLWGILGYLSLVQAIKQKTIVTLWTQTFFIASIIGAPQIVWQLSSNFTDSFTRFQWGWMKQANENIIVFWLRNMGIPFIFLFANFWFIKKLSLKNSWHIHFYVPLMILFLATNLYLFQPHNYDNMKFMIYSYFAICLYMAWYLVDIAQHRLYLRLLAILAVVMTCAVGALSITREASLSWQFSSPLERQAAAELQSRIPPESIVLTSDQHNHFVPTLLGRRILLGYRGWLWTYGITFTAVETDVKAMLSGSPTAAALLKQYNVGFVAITPSELREFNANPTYFDQHATLIWQQGTIRVYDVRTLERQ
jgi:hypothetical protein